MKHTQDKYGDSNLWDWEIEYLTKLKQADPDKARSDVIVRWMELGNLRPLATAIAEGHPLSEDVLISLAGLILHDRLTFKPDRGRPKQANKDARDIVAWLLYVSSTYDEVASDDKFKLIAEELGVSEQSVRQAVTALRKSQR